MFLTFRYNLGLTTDAWAARRMKGVQGTDTLWRVVGDMKLAILVAVWMYNHLSFLLYTQPPDVGNVASVY